MENLNAEQVKRALECCKGDAIPCADCIYADFGQCQTYMATDALSLIKSQEQRIKELTEENERLERICKSYADDECENLPVLVDGKEVGTWDGIVHIFCCGRAKQIILTANGDESDRFLSLDDCLDEIECDKENECAIVIIEEGLHGDVYKFGQYSNREWYKCGSTCGFY